MVVVVVTLVRLTLPTAVVPNALPTLQSIGVRARGAVPLLHGREDLLHDLVRQLRLGPRRRADALGHRLAQQLLLALAHARQAGREALGGLGLLLLLERAEQLVQPRGGHGGGDAGGEVLSGIRRAGCHDSEDGEGLLTSPSHENNGWM